MTLISSFALEQINPSVVCVDRSSYFASNLVDSLQYQCEISEGSSQAERDEDKRKERKKEKITSEIADFEKKFPLNDDARDALRSILEKNIPLSSC